MTRSEGKTATVAQKYSSNYVSIVLFTGEKTSGYATWFTAGGAIPIANYDVIDDVITRKL